MLKAIAAGSILGFAGAMAEKHAKASAKRALAMVAGKPNTKVGGRGVS